MAVTSIVKQWKVNQNEHFPSILQRKHTKCTLHVLNFMILVCRKQQKPLSTIPRVSSLSA